MQVETQTITGSQPGRALLIFAGIHGDEYEPLAAVRELLTAIRPEQLAGSVTLVGCANGPAFVQRSRTGPDNLDLARVFPGDPAGSITRQIAHELTQLIHAADYLIDLHTGGQVCRIFPLAGYMLHPDRTILETQRRMARAFHLPLVWGTSPNLDGRSLSAARDAGKPAIYAEWGGGGGCDPRGVRACVQGCLNVLIELGLLAGEPPAPISQVLVEDPREQSGYLQLNYPAPCGGFYQPALGPGEFVSQGTLLGTLWEDFRQPGREIRAAEAGLLILTRIVPAVQAGDSLATIVETTPEAVRAARGAA